MLESELFGFRKGAFTNATQDKKGKIEVANGGSILLDEIGDLSLYSQAKILRSRESHEIAPIGWTEDRKVDVRIFSATNKNIPGLITKGDFREDLYYRLNSIEIQILPLREHKNDFPELAAHYLDIFCKHNNKFIQGFDPNVVHLLHNRIGLAM